MIQPVMLQLQSSSLLRIARQQANGHIGPLGQIVQQVNDSRQHATFKQRQLDHQSTQVLDSQPMPVFVGVFDAMRVEQVTDNPAVGATGKRDLLGVGDAELRRESTQQRSTSGTTRVDQGTVNIEQKNVRIFDVHHLFRAPPTS